MTALAPEISFAVPCHNERQILPLFIARLCAAADALGRSYEIVVTDDASTDGSWECLVALTRRYPALRAQRLARRAGESAASFAAMTAARGALIVTMDADLQNDPADLPRFLSALATADCVCGTRVDRRRGADGTTKAMASRLFNAARRALIGSAVSDGGCTYRAFRRACLAGITFFDGAHRFLPDLMAMRGHRVVEIPIAVPPRAAGRSHYGLLDRLGALRDLLGMRWLKARNLRFTVAERIPP
jgi:dolichol-phosphate mannosyltransferase